MATGLLEVKPDMVEEALELYLESKTKNGEAKEDLFLQAADQLIKGLGALGPHAGELVNIISGKYGDSTPASLALLRLSFQEENPVFPDNLEKQKLVSEIVDEINERWQNGGSS